MKRIIFAVALGLILASSAYGAFVDLNVTDNTILGTTAADTVTVNATTTQLAATSFPAGTAALPSINITGSLTTGFYQSAADEIAISVATANVGTWDGTGLQAAGFNGPIGTVTPAAGTFTNVDVGGTFNFGQEPADLVNGFTQIGDYISYIETFDGGSDANLAADYNIATVVGAGTNTVTVLDGWNELVTGGGGGPDEEMTRSLGLAWESESALRIEGVVSLAAVVAGQTMFFGWYAAANQYVEIIHEPATSANWLLRIDDTAGAETEDSGVIALINTPTKLAIRVSAGGVVDWSIDDVDMATVGITNLMTNGVPHYWRFNLTDVAAAPHTAALDYVIIEKMRLQ